MNIGIIIYLEKHVDNCQALIDKLNKYNIIVTNDCNGKTFTSNTTTYYDKKFYAACVNDGLRYVTQHGCDHIFIIRDNTIIEDTSIIERYIHTFEKTGVHMLFNGGNSFATYDYNGVWINLADRFFKNFIYLNKNCIKQVGYLDEKYKDSFEIFDYYYRLFNKGLVGPVGYFTSPNTSTLQEIDNEIKLDEDMMLRGLKLFRTKYNYLPNMLPILSKDEAAISFNKIYNRFVQNK